MASMTAGLTKFFSIVAPPGRAAWQQARRLT
jgi:hypothetical protein